MVRSVEIAKGFGKRQERFRRQRLIGKEQHQMLDEQFIEAIEQRRAALPAQVDAFNQRANGGGQTINAGKRSQGKLIKNQQVNFLGFAHRFC